MTDMPGELIAVVEASSVIVVAPIRGGSTFDVLLSINRNGGQFQVRLTAKEARRIAAVLKEAAAHAKHKERE